MKTECPYCGQHYEINAEYKGCSVECLSCKREFIIAPRQSHLLADMNPEQRAAVTAQEGYIRVIAGAGTGKTRVLTHRLAYMIEELHIPADSVLSVTFTSERDELPDSPPARKQCQIPSLHVSWFLQHRSTRGYIPLVLPGQLYHHG